MKKYYADYHVHTEFSDDSVCPMQKMAERAIWLGLDEIAFTEHVDYGVKTDLNCNYEKYFQTVSEIREAYRNRISVKCGIEFGVQVHTVEMFQKDCDKYPFDFVILSNHQIDDMEFWNYAYQEGRTQEEYQTDYYQAVYDVISLYREYSVLGHLDLIKRYDKYGDYPDDRVMKYVVPILKKVIEDQKGIEVNTSGFQYGLKDMMPSKRILGLYRELGGRILTIGSDTHDTWRLGDHVFEVREELKKLGFETFCTFEKMEPVYHEL